MNDRNRPSRRRYLGSLAAAGIGAASLAGCLGLGRGGEPDGAPPRPTDLTNPSFEDGLRGWTVGRDIPVDPNTGDPIETDARTTTERAADGERSLQLYLDGRQDDGVLWVQRPVDLRGYETLSMSTFSPQESFNTITKAAAYAGPYPERGHLEEADFDTDRAVEDHEGWETAEYPVTADGDGLVAVGISVVWETEVTRWIDDVRLS